MRISEYICKYHCDHHRLDHHSQTVLSFCHFKSMPPKKTSSIPLGDIVEIVTETRQTRRGLRTTEKEVLIHSSKDKKSGQPSRSKSQPRRNTATKQGCASGHISSDDEETIPLRHTNVQEDILEGQGDDEDDDIEDDEEQAAIPETHGQGNVCPQMASYILTSDCLQTPMDQWIHVRNRYLHLLLEMEGVTKAPKCSLCKEAMAVKCGDCIGGNYFCVSCCLQAHKRSPFHRLFHWTGAHFSPISLYSLGFKLCLEHDGEPCPFTVDVRCVTVPYIRIILTWKQGIRAAQQSLPTKRTSRTEPPSGGQRHPSSIPARDSLGIADTLFDPDDFGKRAPHRVRTSASGNPLVTVVHQSGVFNMEVLFCICPNAGTRDEQLLHAGLFPSSLKQIETAFTFSVLDDFLLDNLECKTTAQQYYSKLQHITNRMFPDHVPVGHIIHLMMCLC